MSEYQLERTVQRTEPPLPRSQRWPHYAAAIAFLVSMTASACAVALELSSVRFPNPAAITARRVIVLQSADGHYLPAGGMVQLAPLAAEAMGHKVLDAVVSIEDRRFYEHGAIDIWSTLRAAKQNFETGEIVSGGSTITQQLVKIMFLQPERTYRRKIQEAVIAIWLAHHLNKNEILTSYLNNVYLGSAAIGFPAAAKVYFDKDVGNLSVAEAAMLAGMINAPSEDDPFHNLDAARRRAAIVLDAMVANGKLSVQDAFLAKLNPAAPVRTEIAPPAAGWFSDWVYRQAAAVTPPLAGTVRIRTTLDLRLQQIAADDIKSALAQYGSAKHVTQAALVAMRPDGAVVAMAGGRSYADSQFNRAVQARRQPGSAFKLFDYYAALRQGYSPESEVLDAPVDVKGWEPENFGRQYHGEVTLAEAFAESMNAATVRLSQQVGVDQVIAAARDLGLRAALKPLPSIVLGTADVSLLDLTSAYDAVRAGVAPIVPWGMAGIRMPDSKDYLRIGPPHATQHSLGPYQDKLISLLQGVVEHGTGRAAALSGFAAGKTGTAQDYRDAWFIGFDNSLTVGVWVGNDDHSPMLRVVGGSIPAMIWKNFMTQAEAITTVAATAAPSPADQTATPPKNASTTEQTASKEVSRDEPPQLEALFDQSSSGAACNIPVCTRFYSSFRPSDCTYQPYSGGPRRLCER
jgi:penicillin-binding protein 1A